LRVSHKRRRGPKTSRETQRIARIQGTRRRDVKKILRGQAVGMESRPGWLVQLLMDQGMTQEKATAEANRRLKAR
jgi:hypothetical protein